MARWKIGEGEIEALVAAMSWRPERPGDEATAEEATEAVDNAEEIITAAQTLLDRLGLF